MSDRERTLRSVGIALDVLDAFRNDVELSVTELAARIDVAKSTASRTAAYLVRRGMLERTAAGRFRLGSQALELGQLATLRRGLSTTARRLLSQACETLGTTVQLGVASGVDVCFLERVEPARSPRLVEERYRHNPLHRSSTGKVLAAWNPDLAEARIAAGLPRSTLRTITDPNRFAEELARVRATGHARSVEETEPGSASLAVPVRAGGRAGPVVAGVGLAGPTVRLAGLGRDALDVLGATALQVGNAIDDGSIALPTFVASDPGPVSR